MRQDMKGKHLCLIPHELTQGPFSKRSYLYNKN